MEAVVAHYAVGLSDIQILQLGFQQTRDDRFWRKLTVAVYDADVSSICRIQPHPHVPTHHSLFGPDHTPYVGQFFCKLSYDLWRPIISTLNIVADKHYLGREIAPAQGASELFDKRDNARTGAVTQNNERKI